LTDAGHPGSERERAGVFVAALVSWAEPPLSYWPVVVSGTWASLAVNGADRQVVGPGATRVRGKIGGCCRRSAEVQEVIAVQPAVGPDLGGGAVGRWVRV
jgi:hypothetical protein